MSLELDHVGRLLHARSDVMTAAQFPSGGVVAWNVPILLRHALLAVHGSERVAAVEVSALTADGESVGDAETWDVDTVVMSAGVSPLAELSQTIGCRVAYVPALGGTVPIHSPQLESTVNGVFLAGSMLGMEGTAVAMAQGRLAGLAAAAGLETPGGSAAVERVRDAEEALMSARRSAVPFLPGVSEGHRRVRELWDEANARSR
jgi:sarcosine oxidase subunit alpha